MMGDIHEEWWAKMLDQMMVKWWGDSEEETKDGVIAMKNDG